MYNSTNKFPKTIYNKIKTESNYHCNSPCTCKFLNYRSEFDIMQIQLYQQDKKMILPQENIKRNF